jgi:hypothetical protein
VLKVMIRNRGAHDGGIAATNCSGWSQLFGTQHAQDSLGLDVPS